MPLVELNGIHINYEEHGDPSGLPILLTDVPPNADDFPDR